MSQIHYIVYWRCVENTKIEMHFIAAKSASARRIVSFIYEFILLLNIWTRKSCMYTLSSVCKIQLRERCTISVCSLHIIYMARDAHYAAWLASPRTAIRIVHMTKKNSLVECVRDAWWLFNLFAFVFMLALKKSNDKAYKEEFILCMTIVNNMIVCYIGIGKMLETAHAIFVRAKAAQSTTT